MTRPLTRVFMLFAGLTLLAVGSASAQACIGVPIPNGAFAIEGMFSSTEGAKAYGGTFTANLTGPLTVQAGYSLTDLDDVEDNGNTFGGNLAYELPTSSFSACPVVGLSYSTFSSELLGVEFDITELVVPIGIGIGKTIPAGESLDLTLFAVPQFLYIRGEIEAAGESESDSESEFGSVLGIRLGSSAIFGGASVFVTSVEDSDPTFTFSLGVAFGGRR